MTSGSKPILHFIKLFNGFLLNLVLIKWSVNRGNWFQISYGSIHKRNMDKDHKLTQKRRQHEITLICINIKIVLVTILDLMLVAVVWLLVQWITLKAIQHIPMQNTSCNLFRFCYITTINSNVFSLVTIKHRVSAEFGNWKTKQQPKNI